MHILFLHVQYFNEKEHHFIFPPVIATFIMQPIAYIYSPSQDSTNLIFPSNKTSYIFRRNFN